MCSLGAVVADRFELEQLAGEGAMGAAWSARDRASGARVASAAIVSARRLLDRASRIGAPDYRSSFLERVPEHALTMELYARWVASTR